MTLDRNTKIILLAVLSSLTFVFWLVLNASHTQGEKANYLFEAVMVLTPVTGGILGLHTARHWSGMKSQVGQGISYIAFGLLAWGLGQAAWTYYNLLSDIDTPYPSLADIGYVAAVPLWAFGVYKLSKATGAKYGLQKTWGKAAMLLVPLLSVGLSYVLLVTVARSGHLSSNSGVTKVFFDFAYPLGDVIIITLALTIIGLSWRYLGGKFKTPLLLLFVGFVMLYAADFSFSYTTTKATFFSGSWVDMLYTSVMAVISVGLVMLDPIHHLKPIVPTAPPAVPPAAPNSQV